MFRYGGEDVNGQWIRLGEVARNEFNPRSHKRRDEK